MEKAGLGSGFRFLYWLQTVRSSASSPETEGGRHRRVGAEIIENLQMENGKGGLRLGLSFLITSGTGLPAET
jgi:hypothetical protein